MSTLGDILGFEKFNLKDMLRKVKKNPERLLLGAADPVSSKFWGKVTGEKYEPIVDQMGGAYGGHTISAFGNTDGGVYRRAREAGIDTGAGGTIHDIAHIVSALYAGNYGAGKLKGLRGSGEPSKFDSIRNLMPQQQGSQPVRTAPPPPEDDVEDEQAARAAQIAAEGTRARFLDFARQNSGQLVSQWGVR